jgi:hypothetical protein
MMRDEIDEKFRTFHEANPQVYDELVRLAREALSYRRRRIGIRMCWEVMRWNLTVVRRYDDDFHLNDHFHSRYARLIMDQETDLRGVFETRTLKSVA